MTGFKLVPFSENNSDIVLGWRNSERIRSNMLDNSVIEGWAHRKFLNLLAEDRSRAYFVVELNDMPVAAIYFTGLGAAEVTWGCYIGSERVIPGLFLALVVIAIKYSFDFTATTTLRSEVAAHNANPVKLNRFLGIPETARKIRQTTSGMDVEFIEYLLGRDGIDLVLSKARKVMPSSVRESCEILSVEK